ncbi:hypothetical protein pVco7_gp012 [Vibrio phage pVco-7]|uniref:Uncharacterized protein n=1 Tax=Vibrio phage pVco-5 TaxID=1965485 RepID=A0A1W6JUQ5_9CAUD|nr:hypothetical protein KNT61_gp013 [Vibrio phage pVco-5]ARM71001.1 hypothetical protein pVco5_013 [Vibrio phage pVco-5]
MQLIRTDTYTAKPNQEFIPVNLIRWDSSYVRWTLTEGLEFIYEVS